jgi:type VI secretion system protein ImpG
MPLDDELLDYYERELTYLRRMGGEFAQRYPKVAGRLELGPDHCPDPTIERLIESVAFLTGRLHHNIDSLFPEISTALLGILYPHFLSPVPSMSIARFEPDPDQLQPATAFVVRKHTPLSAVSEQGEICRFRTCYPVALRPVRVTHAGFESTDRYDFLDNAPGVITVLRLRIETMGETLENSGLDSLRFFLNGEGTLPLALYELLFGNTVGVVLLPDTGSRPVRLGADAIAPVGFGPEEDALPWQPYAHPGYRLLQEYFTFQEKFLFFDLNHLERHASRKHFDVLILLNRRPRENLVIDTDTFALGCTPIINLFRKTTEPIRWDHRQREHRLTPDMRRERSTEIHSVLKVSSVSDERDDTQVFEPFYSFNHTMEDSGHRAFWHSRRDFTGKKNLPGTEVFLTFLDLDFNPALPPTETVYAHTLCTNRDLAEQLQAQAVLQVEEAAPVTRVTCLKKPTRQIQPTLSGQAQWKFISHLSLNFLSIAGGPDGLKALQEILNLYGFANQRSIAQQIVGLREMTASNVVRRVGNQAWRGFCRGLELTLTFDENLYAGNSAFLLAAVLERFFPLYASINTFTQLAIKSRQRDGVWKTWPPRVGEQIVL